LVDTVFGGFRPSSQLRRPIPADSHQGDEPGVPDTDPDAYLEELGIVPI